jgi:hypothetical protein
VSSVSDLRTELLAQLDRAIAICEAATPGPWNFYPGTGKIGRDDFAVGTVRAACYTDQLESDGKLMAAARSAYPALLRATREEVERHCPLACNECCKLHCDAKECQGFWPCRYLRDLSAALSNLEAK